MLLLDFNTVESRDCFESIQRLLGVSDMQAVRVSGVQCRNLQGNKIHKILFTTAVFAYLLSFNSTCLSLWQPKLCFHPPVFICIFNLCSGNAENLMKSWNIAHKNSLCLEDWKPGGILVRIAGRILGRIEQQYTIAHKKASFISMMQHHPHRPQAATADQQQLLFSVIPVLFSRAPIL